MVGWGPVTRRYVLHILNPMSHGTQLRQEDRFSCYFGTGFQLYIKYLGGATMDSQRNAKFTDQILQSIAKYVAIVICLMGAFIASPSQAASVALSVLSTNGAGPISAYKYIINVDNTGTTEQRSPAPGTGCSPQDLGYPGSCHWVSIAGAKTSSPVLMQGDQVDFTGPMNLPNGRYLISVLAKDYKLDGQHFTVTDSGVIIDGVNMGGTVTVKLRPTPLPDAQIQAAVFEDVSPVNSAPDLPAEHGLAGFQGHITDTLGEVTTNVYGHPLCSKYSVAGDLNSLIAGSGGRCLSACYVVNNGLDVGTVAASDAAGRCPVDITVVTNGVTQPRPMLEGGTVPASAVIEGKVKIPNLGPNRYALSVTPPDGSGWVQTTTLEGNHDWDAWVMEGATGLDTEFIIAGEPFPAIIFGYVPAPGTPSAVGSALPASLGGTATIQGVVERVKIYVPTTGGVGGLPGEIWGGLQGAVIDKPIENPWVTLTNLGNGDTIVWAGQGGLDGTFKIPNVPAGTYTLTWWDEPQNHILDLVNVTVAAGETIDMGILPLSGWWTIFDGYVFDDANRNGVKDPGEQGLAGYTLTMRRRDNSLMDRGSTVVSTDANGYYKFEAAYPMTQWLVMEAYDNLHYGTGVTYQADNQPTPTTSLGAGVDVSVHPIIGLSGRLDWGKHTYDTTGANGIDPRNGGIVGTVSYDTTRNELDPRYAAVEDWQPSIPDMLVKLFKPVPCGTTGVVCTTSIPKYELASDGSLAKGKLLNTYLSETWFRPGANGNGTGCTVRGADGTPVTGADQQFLPTDQANSECIEAPMTGVQFSPDAANVNGNYGFGDGCFGVNGFNEATGTCSNGSAPSPLTPGDYLVQVDLNSLVDLLGRPIYKVTREEDVNIGNGDAFFPPAVPPSACVGPLHVVDSSGNAGFPGGPGTSPYEGMSKPLCDTKLVRVSNGSSIAPSFNVYTDVPLPGRHWFIIIDDLNFSSNPQSITFGEKAGMPFVPVGIYDYANRLVTTVESDYNGLADVLLPSTNRINCPTPSGVCANLYRYVGNDPGIPGRLNPNFNPLFRTIAAEFEVLPGLIIPADLAPTQVGVTVQLPGAQTTSPVMCMLADTTPQIYAVDTPYGNASAAAVPVTIKGKGFGASQGTGLVTLGGVSLATPVWSDSSITATVPVGTIGGPKQLMVTAGNGQTTVNGITFHVIKTDGIDATNYNPKIYEVGPGKTYAPAESLPAAADHAIQRALDRAAADVAGSNAISNRGTLVVVYPNTPSANPRQNPRGAYYENLIITSKVKLQGVGPGSPDGSVRGSIIDGGAFAGDSPVATDWQAKIATLTWAGNQTVYDGAVISIYVPNNGNRAFPTAYNAKTAPTIDGFDLRGGDQAGFPGNINAIGGTPTGLPGGLITQGGAIFANAYARNLQITNNVVQNNGGAYGTIRIGTPDLPQANNNNQKIVIAFNRITQNAGTNQAGGIGLFSGSDDYQVVSNDICGNFSSEYGGGVSAVGYSPRGSISKNRIYFNRSFDEGGGIMIAGALPANTSSLSPGSGPVTISGNLIQANLSNDDGGGIRFLMAGNFPMNVFNNFIVNNISTHEGGGIAINDAPDVRVYNNTIMKNLTTATALTSNGAAAPAGLSTSVNSTLLQATLPGGVAGCGTGTNASCFSNPLLFNNIFWDNRAGTRTGGSVIGLSAADADYWDLGVADVDAPLAPTNSVIQQTRIYTASASNATTDPQIVTPYDVGVTFNTWRNNPSFLGAIMISADLPPTLMGDYHLLASSSPAFNRGVASRSGVNAPLVDIDSQKRPMAGLYDAGADEFFVPPAPLAAVTPTALSFGNLSTGTNTDLMLTVNNTGDAALTGIIVDVTGAGYLRNGGNCGTSLNPTSSCTIIVRFSPTAAIAYTGSVAITAGNGTVAGAPVSLTGTGVAAPVVSVSPSPLAFGDHYTGTTTNLPLTLSNTGSTALSGIAVNVTGPRFARNGGTCGTSLAAGTSCTIIVRFNPNVVGAYTGSVAITASNGTVTGAPVALSGAGVAPPPPPTLSSISPTSSSLAQRGTAVSVTLNGTNLSGATGVNVSGSGVNVNSFTVISATKITASFQISGGSGNTGSKNVTVVTPGGTSTAVTFTKN